MTKEIKPVDRLTTAILDGGSGSQFKGAAGAAIGIALLSVTHAVPEIFELWVQGGCLVLFAVGLVKIIYHTII